MLQNGFRRLKIDGWRQFQSIDIELHPRLTIITGANGAGKSTLLSFFTRHFGYHRNYLATPQMRGGITRFTFGLFDSLRKNGWFGRGPAPSDAPQIGEIEYINGHKSPLRLPRQQGLHYGINIDSQQSVPGVHIDSHRPPNIYRGVAQFPAMPPQVNQIGNVLNNEYMTYFSSGQIQQGSLHHIKMTLIQMSIFGHGNSTMEPVPELLALFGGFEAILKKILPRSLGFNRLIIRSPEVLLSTKSGDFLIDAASGGIIKLFEVAWQLYFFSKTVSDFVITFDEPENHLHPSMQKSFLPSLLEAFPGCQIIVVTHSPFIISAMRDSSVYVLRYADTELLATDTDDDKSVLGMMGSRVIAERLDTVNKAGTASEILRDVLGITTTIPDWAEDRVNSIVAEYRGRSLDENALKQLYNQLEKEGLISSYPVAVSALTRRQ
ncbi:AAA family ATPase [Sphingomonas sanguinis]|uniref:AAA family ATPase n=1 Tax=Sphingomonas sanguinis TaxID=33051 RepID=A0ABU5LQF7_9SPHN|nr:AAA family ATPase [Sphingomonas sanguinis]MDZ7282178.1 AAA family ATPase [Sphingomonas sanguinis]